MPSSANNTAADARYCSTQMAAECRAHLREADPIGGVVLQQQCVGTPVEDSRAAMLALLDRESQIVPDPLVTGVVEERGPDRLPSALHPCFGSSMRALHWRRVAPGVQRLLASDIVGGDLMLLRIAPGSKLPLHSHSGNELTMILDGAYDDLLGHFGPGDVADLDGETLHQPVTAPGVPCICVVATDAPLKFSGWYARALQPLVGF